MRLRQLILAVVALGGIWIGINVQQGDQRAPSGRRSPLVRLLPDFPRSETAAARPGSRPEPPGLGDADRRQSGAAARTSTAPRQRRRSRPKVHRARTKPAAAAPAAERDRARSRGHARLRGIAAAAARAARDHERPGQRRSRPRARDSPGRRTYPTLEQTAFGLDAPTIWTRAELGRAHRPRQRALRARVLDDATRRTYTRSTSGTARRPRRVTFTTGPDARRRARRARTAAASSSTTVPSSRPPSGSSAPTCSTATSRTASTCSWATAARTTPACPSASRGTRVLDRRLRERERDRPRRDRLVLPRRVGRVPAEQRQARRPRGRHSLSAARAASAS